MNTELKEGKTQTNVKPKAKQKKPIIKKMVETMVTQKKGSGRRYSEGKTRMALFPAWAYEQICKVYTKGADKYTVHDDEGNIIDSGDNNWMNGMDWSVPMNSMERHYNSFKKGNDFDFDPNCIDCRNGDCMNHTGLYHMAQVAWNAIALLEFYRTYPQGDNRVKNYLTMPKIGLDIDEVLCDWVNAWRSRFNIENVATSWFFDREIRNRFEQMREDNELDDFYLNLDPHFHGSELPFEPHCYITSRPVDSEVTMKWLDQHGFPTKPVHTVGTGQSKVDVAKESGIDIFVDDSYDNFVQLNNAGIFTYLYDAPHNHKYEVGHHRIKSLSDIPIVG
jgi:hypothetical protein